MPMENKGTLGETAIRCAYIVVGSAVGVLAWAVFAPHPATPVEQHTFVQPAAETSSTPARVPATLKIQPKAVPVTTEGTVDPTTSAPAEPVVTLSSAATPVDSTLPTPSPPASQTTSPAIGPTDEKIWGEGETPGSGNGTIEATHSAAASTTSPPPVVTTPAVPNAGH